MKNPGWLALIFLGNAIAAGSGGINAENQRDKPYLILISIDGFRWDYQDDNVTPALDRIAASGIRTDAMRPVFPTLTFPNHYSIATGLYPANHKLIGNRFPSIDRERFYDLRNRDTVQDGSWYGGEPVWVAAEKQGMVTAAYYFVGTEAPINDIPMTYWHQFDASVPGEVRVAKALEWLSMPVEARPHLITLYFEDVDAATHGFGPGSKQSVAAVERVDAYLTTLMTGIDELSVADDVYLFVVSDHGQGAFVPDASPFIIDEVANIDDVIVVDHGTSAFLYLRQPDDVRANAIRDAINDKWLHGRAMRPADTPADWHVADDGLFADIIVQADPGYSVYTSAESAVHRSIGDHGWPRDAKDMHGIFLASGPRLPKGLRIPAIDNVDVYPLMMEVLELAITTPIDGDTRLLPDLLN